MIKLINGDDIHTQELPQGRYTQEFKVNSKKVFEKWDGKEYETNYKANVLNGQDDKYIYINVYDVKATRKGIFDQESGVYELFTELISVDLYSEIRIPITSILYIEEDI